LKLTARLCGALTFPLDVTLEATVPVAAVTVRGAEEADADVPTDVAVKAIPASTAAASRMLMILSLFFLGAMPGIQAAPPELSL
jgi:hypothetical protein